MHPPFNDDPRPDWGDQPFGSSGEAKVFWPRAYGPRTRGRWRNCLLTLVAGGLWAAVEWPKPVLHVAAGQVPGNLAADITAAIVLAAGLLMLINLLRGRPRLTIGPAGMTIQHSFRTQSAAWADLGEFRLIPAVGRRGWVAASIIAPWDTRSGGRERLLTIHDAFAVPLDVIMGDINDRHTDPLTDLSPVDSLIATPVGVAGFRWPWLTVTLLSAFVAVFGLEHHLALQEPGRGWTPGLGTLIALGGVSRNLVRVGEWYRLVTAPFLHAGITHLVANCVAFGLAGYALERLTGRVWMFCIFATGAIGGSIASILLNAPTTVSVGASGAIVAMMVVLFCISFRMEAGRIKQLIQIQSVRVAIPALIPVAHVATEQAVDYGAHLGGGMLGGVLGVLLLASWGDHLALPRFRSLAVSVAGAAVLAFTAGGYAVAQHYASYRPPPYLIPFADMPKGEMEMAWAAPRLLIAYPHDPRAHYMDGFVRYRRGDKDGAEREFRIALSMAEDLPSPFDPHMVSNYRGMLALVVREGGHVQEARSIAHAACLAEGDAAPQPALVNTMARIGLCSQYSETRLHPG
jgi:membrane associated rhomboid family serine protease